MRKRKTKTRFHSVFQSETKRKNEKQNSNQFFDVMRERKTKNVTVRFQRVWYCSRKKHRTHYSRGRSGARKKVLQTRLLCTFPLKMYQYFKYSNSLLFPFDRCRRVASGLLISEVQAFLQKPSSIIIILIFVNRTLRRIKSSRLIGLVLHAVTFLQGTSQP